MRLLLPLLFACFSSASAQYYRSNSYYGNSSHCSSATKYVTKKVFAGYDCRGYPVYRYYSVPVRTTTYRTHNPHYRPAYNPHYRSNSNRYYKPTYRKPTYNNRSHSGCNNTRVIYRSR